MVVDGTRVLILDTGTGEVHAEHPLTSPGEASVLDEHYGGARPAVPVRVIRPRSAAEVAFCALGPAAEAFIAGAAGAGHTRLGPELAELNTLSAAHGQAAMVAALERATAFGRWRAADVRSILAAGAAILLPRQFHMAIVENRHPADIRRAAWTFRPSAMSSISTCRSTRKTTSTESAAPAAPAARAPLSRWSPSETPSSPMPSKS